MQKTPVKHGAEEAADAVDAEGVERIVVLEERLQTDHGVADDAGEQADGQARPAG